MPCIAAYRSARITGKNRQIYQLSLINGMKLTATSDHRILTTAGLKELKYLKAGDTVYIINDYLRWREINEKGSTTTVKRIDNLKKTEDVYCLTVPETECFAVNGGLIVANSKDVERYVLYTIFGKRSINYDTFLQE
jgi:intein/homing endonuclease